MRKSWIASLFLAARVLGAQQSAAPKHQAPPKQESGSIQGRVVNAVTGEAVKKADIVLSRSESQQNQSYTTTTSAGGWFAMQDVEPGRYRLMVSKRGYAHLQYGAHGPGRAGAALSLDPGQHLADITLRMSPQAVIAGRVIDEDGDPVPFIGVQLMHYTYHKGKRKLESWDNSGTNDLGEYRLFGLSPGRYYLSATPFERPRLTGGQGYAPTYYPGTSDPASATALELQSGTVRRGVDITLTKTRTVRLRGRVVAPMASAIMGTYVTLTQRDDSQSIFERQDGANMDPQGNFEFPSVVPGAYIVQATKNSPSKMYAAVQAVDARGNDVENIVLELAPAAELRGNLRVEGRALTSLGDLQVALQPDGATYGWAVGQVKADGTFTIPNVTPTHYELNVHGFTDDYYIKSAAAGGKDILEGGFTFAPGTNSTIEIVLSGTGGQVEGVVLNADQQPATEASVVAVPDEPRRTHWRFYKDGHTDQYGRFTIKALAPGRYKLFAWEDVEEGAYQDPDFIRKFEPLGEAVVIRENSHESAQLKLIPAGEKKSPK
ncbi:MAG TPA: carboxypeptidase-like regulatory domain-containing protein [Bryobacteraceae bacterium]|nr:carboxypeptidase-like regulatory domain-containing protein [Bryobacteraceae bacterium]